MQKKRIITFLILFVSFFSYAQQIDDYFNNAQSVLVQKLYLHTDREFYFLGDTIWFAAYLVDGEFHTPVQENSNLYVELIGTDGKIATRETYPLVNGFGQGYLAIKRKEMKDGNYLLRAYNSYLLNFGNDLLFTKRIKIAETRNMFEFPEQVEPDSTHMKIQVDFYPEGGFMLAGQINQVAFTIADSEGKGKNEKGKLLDENGNIVLVFSTLYQGMGKFYFIPEKNQKYYVLLDSNPELKWDLPEVQAEGAKIMVSKIDTGFVNVNILKSEKYANDKFYLALMHRGYGLAYIEIDRANTDKLIQLNSGYFRDGINRIILLNDNYEPLSERLVYMDKSESVNLDIALNKTGFTTRDKVVFSIASHGNENIETNARLSVAVVNNNALNSAGISQNIKTYLLMDAELKGNIKNPADYYIDEGKLTSLVKLDLLMLTRGWTNYIWNDLQNKEVDIDTTIQDFGFSFRGTLYNLTGRKIIENSEVILGLNAGAQSKLFFTNSDEQGKFEFDNIIFADSAVFFLQGKNTRDKPNTSIELEQITPRSPEINYDAMNKLRYYSDIPQSFYRLNYLNEMALKQFFPDRDTKLLDEIKVKGIKPKKDDGHFRLYSAPSVSLKLKSTDYTYSNILQYLQGRVAGLTVSGNNVTIRGPSSLMGSDEPLFLYDGIPVDKETILSISMSDVDKVEVLKGSEGAIYGMRGANGVISVLTKKVVHMSLNHATFPVQLSKE